MKTTVEIFDGEARAAFQKMLEGADPQVYLNAIAGQLVASTTERFNASVAPDGAAWKAVLRGGRPLQDEGLLYRSVHAEIDRNSLTIGTPYAWAWVHQFGAIIRAKITGKYLRFKIGDRWASKKEVTIPARPFLGISAEDRVEITEILRNKLLGDR